MSGSHKQLQDDHVHAVIATSEYAPPPYEDVLSFVAKRKEDGNLKAHENPAFDFTLGISPCEKMVANCTKKNVY